SNPIIKFGIGMLTAIQGRYDDAVRLMEANQTGMVRALVESSIANALFFAGRTDEARARIEDAKFLSATDPTKYKDEGGILASMQAVFLAIAGDKTRALENID